VGPAGVFPAIPTTIFEMKRFMREAAGPTLASALDLAGVGQGSENMWFAAAKGDPDAKRQIFSGIMRALPAGVGIERFVTATQGVKPIGLTGELRGRRGRITVKEENTDRWLRALIGARTKKVISSIEDVKQLGKTERATALETRIFEEWVFDNPQLASDPAAVQRELMKIGPIKITGLSEKYSQREMPLLLRRWLGMRKAARLRIMQQSPRLYGRITQQFMEYARDVNKTGG